MIEFKSVLNRLLAKENLTQSQAEDLLNLIAGGHLSSAQIAAILMALRAKGETVEEIAGFAMGMRAAANKPVLKSHDYVDCCGTGGDAKGGINISTAAAFVVAGAGFKVAKHGNRSISSKCGSADVLELMGVRLDPPLAQVEHSLETLGIGFLYAPAFHPAMKQAMLTRRELGVRTIFNVLGPLTNPAMVKVQLIGVFDPGLTKTLAQVLGRMKHKAGMVIHSRGWDEITLDNTTQVSEMVGGKVRNYTLTHKDFGLPKVSSQELQGGDPQCNANVLLELLDGKKTPLRHIVLANAAAAIYIAEKGLRKRNISLKTAVKVAEESLDSKKALDKFKRMAQLSHIFE